jgi:Heterokaryon incompatibility protein (HET)
MLNQIYISSTDIFWSHATLQMTTETPYEGAHHGSQQMLSQEKDPQRQLWVRQRKRKLGDCESVDHRERNLPCKSLLQQTATTTADDLCGQCRSIDFDAIFGSDVKNPNGIKLEREKECPTCPLCRLFIDVRSDQGSTSGYEILAFSSSDILAKERAGEGKDDCALAVIGGWASSKRYPIFFSKCRSRGFIVPVSSSLTLPLCPGLYRGCQVDTARISYERLQGWLTQCQNSHSTTCGVQIRVQPMSLRCIDCLTRELVQIDSNDKYFALSYVWGAPLSQAKEDVDHIQDIGILSSSKLPQVVEDALTVVKRLGQRYLWIDKYCIDRRDNDYLAYQIRNMDRIYESAYATIVACAGKDASCGLPGVGTTHRRRQPSAMVRDELLVSTLPHISSVLNSSVWATRGWTYQEAVLSRRCLFFTELQVYFVCAAMTCCEAVVSGLEDTTLGSMGDSKMLSAGLFSENKPGSELWEFTRHVTQYTGRQLTYEKDALDAFRGVLSRSQFHNYYGIPIGLTESPRRVNDHEELDLGFAQGLYWLPKAKDGLLWTSLSRRSWFPTWSWVGWQGSVEYPDEDGAASSSRYELIMADRKNFDTKFWVEKGNGQRVTLGELCRSTAQTKSIIELSRYLIVEAWVVQLWFQPGFFGGARLTICHCHPQTTHKGALKWEDRGDEVILCEQPTEKGEFYDRLITQLWSCVLIFCGSDEHGGLHNLMVIDRLGGLTHRIGAITLRSGKGGEFWESLPKTRQSVRLA